MGTGLDTQLGTAEEVTYGTPVTVNKFYEIENESLDLQTTVFEYSGLRPGLAGYRLGSRRVQTRRQGAGGLTLPVTTVGMGRWFKHMLGGTPTSAQQGGTTAYLQTFTPGTLDGKSLTIQKGITPTGSSTALPFTFHGCKITDWQFSVTDGGALMLGLTVDAEDVDKSTGLATASYGTIKPFHYAQGAITVAGTTVATVYDPTWGGSNPSKTDRNPLGAGLLKKEPLTNDYRTVGGSLTAEFADYATFYDRFAADTSAALVLTFTGDTISGIYTEKIQFTIPDVRFTGETPKAGGPDLIMQNVPFEGRSDGTNPVITIAYTTTDTTV